MLKVGGVLNVLEFSKVTCPLLSVPYDVWSYGFMPQAGRVLADEESYRYLVDSIRAFPDQETFAQIFRVAGFGSWLNDTPPGGIPFTPTVVKTTPTAVTYKRDSSIPTPEKAEEATDAKPEPNSV